MEDWLQINCKVLTPRGEATVFRISEDDGVHTSKGNFCRTELKEFHKEAYMPKVGEACEMLIGKWEPVTPLFIGDQLIVIDICSAEVAYRLTAMAFRPIKTEREKFIDRANKVILDGGYTNKWAEVLYDSGARFESAVVTKDITG